VALAQFVGGHPVGRDVTADLEAGVFQRLVDRHVGVLEIVLADQRDVDLAVFLRGDDVAPLVRSLALRERLIGETEVLEDVLVEPLVFDHQRDVIDVLDVGIREHRIRRNVTEQRDLLLGLGVEAVLAPADDHVWLKADRTDLLDRVLGRLRLLLAVFEYGTSVTWVKRTFSSGSSWAN